MNAFNQILISALCWSCVVAAAAERPMVIPPDRLGHYWLLDPASAQARVPNSGHGLDAPTCAAVSYIVEKNGTTSHVKLERMSPQSKLGQVAVNIVAGMQFAPASSNLGKDRVSTYVVIPFNLPPASDTKPADRALRERVLGACQLDKSAKDRNDVVHIVQ